MARAARQPGHVAVQLHGRQQHHLGQRALYFQCMTALRRASSHGTRMAVQLSSRLTLTYAGQARLHLDYGQGSRASLLKFRQKACLSRMPN